jgi:hypothetical protein
MLMARKQLIRLIDTLNDPIFQVAFSGPFSALKMNSVLKFCAQACLGVFIILSRSKEKFVVWFSSFKIKSVQK